MINAIAGLFAIALVDGCIKPPIWPEEFKITQRKVPDSDLLCAANCSDVTMYYSWLEKVNLIIDTPDADAASPLWDLELNSGESYYYHRDTQKCTHIHFDVGILTRDWLLGATSLGSSLINGTKVWGWSKADFIDYHVDAEDCITPVSWYFHGMKTTFVTLKFSEGEVVPDKSFFTPPSFCPNITASSSSISAATSTPWRRERAGDVSRPAEAAVGAERGAGREAAATSRGANSSLVQRLCVGRCDEQDCKKYVTPVDECYSPAALFPGDEQWGAFDARDVLSPAGFTRSFFESTDGTCTSRDGAGIDLPLGECVGPFGKPRPWGSFKLV